MRTRQVFTLGLAAAATLPAVSLAATGGAFNVSWTDRAGNVHPLNSTQLTLYDLNNGVETAIGSWITNETGRMVFSTNYVRPDGGPLQLVVDVRAVVAGAGTAGTSFNGTPFAYRLPGTFVFQNNTFGMTYTTSAVTNANDAGKAIGFMQGLKVASDHFRSLGANVPYASVRFAPQWGTGSYMSGPNMNLGYDCWGAWDVALHEFSHGVADINQLDREPHIGLAHSFNQDNVAAGPKVGPFLGTQLAWQEGIASYLGNSALRNRLPLMFPGMPATDADPLYDRFSSTGTITPDSSAQFSVSLEERAGTIQGAPFFIPSKGEGDELSVARVLWDLEDDTPGEALPRPGRTDRVALGAQAVYDLMATAGAGADGGRFGAFWREVVDAHGITPRERSLLGDVLEANAISAVPGAAGGVPDGGITSSHTPTLAWTAQNSGHSSQFQVAVYSDDWLTLERLSPVLAGASFWELDDPLALGSYHWVVIGNSVTQSALSFDHSYWSGAASFAIVPEPGWLGAAGWVMAAAAGRRRRRAG